jgi:hypothetical protein
MVINLLIVCSAALHRCIWGELRQESSLYKSPPEKVLGDAEGV